MDCQVKQPDQRPNQFFSERNWFDLNIGDDGRVRMIHEFQNEMFDPPEEVDPEKFDRIFGSLMGLAIGDALGSSVEFQCHAKLVDEPVTDLKPGGTWGLETGKFTDDTSTAMCLAISLLSQHGFRAYDQLVRYKWWYRHGYLSSTGECFDIGQGTRHSIEEFERRQVRFSKKKKIRQSQLDHLSDETLLREFNTNCSSPGVAGNGALMRLAPVPLFFHKYLEEAIQYSGLSALTTHGDVAAVDACRYFGALLFAILNNYTKEELLDNEFYRKHRPWFGEKEISTEIQRIIKGSYKVVNGYEGGIRGSGYVVLSLQAALWAFWSDENSFEKGVLAAVNLGDDTDTTAAIYGQLAGAYYGFKKLPTRWANQIYAHDFILKVSKWITYESEQWKPKKCSELSGYSPLAIDELQESSDDWFINKKRSELTQDIHSGSKSNPLRKRVIDNLRRFGPDLTIASKPVSSSRKGTLSFEKIDEQKVL